MKKTLTNLGVISCIMLATNLAYADGDTQGRLQEKVFKTIDTNSDGNISREEYNSFADKQFKNLDGNGNNQITLEELKDGARKMMSGGRPMEEKDYKLLGDTRDQPTNSSWDKDRDDAWHKNMDSSWDKKRDDTWHKDRDNIDAINHH